MRGSIVIVTYNCAGYIRGCLSSLRGLVDGWEVIVADNGSRDDTVEVVRGEFPWVTLIPTGANRGFSAANNTGATRATAPWVFFLNPDTVVEPTTLDRLIAGADTHKAVAIAPMLVGTDGVYQSGASDDRMPTFGSLLVESVVPRPLRPAGRGPFDPSRAQTIERQMAAAIMIRADIYKEIGGFDERFTPIWFEDVDLCKRLRERGHEIWYEPSSVVTHVGQHTLTMYNVVSVLGMWNANMIRYVRKHFPGWQAGALRVAATTGVVLRGLVRAFDPRFARSAPDHFQLAWRMMRYNDESRWYGWT